MSVAVESEDAGRADCRFVALGSGGELLKVRSHFNCPSTLLKLPGPNETHPAKPARGLSSVPPHSATLHAAPQLYLGAHSATGRAR
ncbi:MAG: hypothetical protein AAFV85_27380 [Cyanobacteria bacterium J06634_6]